MSAFREFQDIWHQLLLQIHEEAKDIAGFVVVIPRHPVRAGTVQTAVGGKQAESNPALVEIRRALILKASYVMAPEAEAAVHQGKAAAQGFRHGNILAGGVPAPVNRELLAAGRGAAGKEAGLPFSSFPDKQVKNAFVVKMRVIIMHLHRVRAVIPDHVRGNSLAEIRLEAVHSHVKQGLQFRLIPGAGIRVREIHQGHSGLPQIPLPDFPAVFLQEVARLHPLAEERRFLRDIGVDPDADLQAPLMVAAEHSFRIREHILIPEEIAPLEAFHPETVKMEDLEGDLPLPEAFDESRDGVFVVIGRKRGRQPEAEGPFGRKRRTAGQGSVFLNDLLRSRPVNDKELQLLILHGKLDCLHFFASDLEADRARMVDKHAVAGRSIVEGDVFIGDLAGGAAVFIPHIHDLAVFYHGSEPFAQSVDQFPHAEVQACENVILPALFMHHPHAPGFCAGKRLSLREIIHFRAALGKPDADFSG